MKALGLIAAVLLLAACGDTEPTPQVAAEPVVSRPMDAAQITRGGQLFAQNCAVCHGVDGEGAAQWQRVGADGKWPAPPLNGTGHAWHHPRQMLHQVIKHGSPGGQGNMPDWKGKLSDEQIDDVIAWFQSRWPHEVYAAWNRSFQGE